MATSKKKKTAKGKKTKAELEFTKRSKAAKKGWATRRKNSLKKTVKNNKKKLVNAQSGLPKKKRKVIPRLPSLSGKTKKELEDIIRKQHKKIVLIEETKGWVDAVNPEFLSRKGHITLKPSRIRHLGEDTDEIIDRLERAAKSPLMSNPYDDDAFRNEANRVAAEWNCPLGEVYTLWYSP